MLLDWWAYSIIFLIGCILSVLLDIINSRSFSIFVLLTALFTPSWVNDWFSFEGCTSEYCLTLLKNKILKWEMTGYYISWLGFICYSILFFPFSSGFCGVFAWDFLIYLSLFQWFLGNFLFFYLFISSWIYVSLLVVLFIFASFLFAFAINLWWFH